MKLLRIGSLGKEKPVVLDKDGKYKDLSLHVEDLNPNNGLSTRAISSVFLLILIMIGFIGNSIIVGTIGSSLVLKR